jgi:23S rRNA pseudouridine2605 synthase
MEERLQKLLAQAGHGSRRACEELIKAGRVSVNGRLAELGSKADPGRDRITLDGNPLSLAEPQVYIALYKPRGIISAVESPDPRPTVRSLVDIPERIYPVGRLDADSEGLILLTNDGDLANRLTHPRYEHEKEYRVLVARRPDEDQLSAWRNGVVLEDDFRTAPAQVELVSLAGKGAWLRVIMKEGHKRQIRETGLRIGLPVVRIIRVRIGALLLGGLKPRQWRMLTPAEIASLKTPPARSPRQPAKPRRAAPAANSAPRQPRQPANAAVSAPRQPRQPANAANSAPRQPRPPANAANSAPRKPRQPANAAETPAGQPRRPASGRARQRPAAGSPRSKPVSPRKSTPKNKPG